MEKQLIIAGFGGQGVLLMGQLLAYAGMLRANRYPGCPRTAPKCAAAARTAPW